MGWYKVLTGSLAIIIAGVWLALCLALHRFLTIAGSVRP